MDYHSSREVICQLSVIDSFMCSMNKTHWNLLYFPSELYLVQDLLLVRLETVFILTLKTFMYLEEGFRVRGTSIC